MRKTQLTLLQSTILMAIVGLVCSIPKQCLRNASRDHCRVLAQYHAMTATQLTLTADAPGKWLDEFRQELRLMAAKERDHVRCLELAGFFDREEEKRINEAEIGANGLNVKQFWARFNAAAALHGFKRPRPTSGPMGSGSGLVDWLAGCWPTFIAIAVLIRVLGTLRRPRIEPEW